MVVEMSVLILNNIDHYSLKKKAWILFRGSFHAACMLDNDHIYEQVAFVGACIQVNSSRSAAINLL